MMKASMKISTMVICCLVMLFVSLSARSEIPTAKEHPTQVDEPVCSSCHTDKDWMDHTPAWGATHRFAASEEDQTCGLCHRPAYCMDCHALQEEIKPSDKHKDSPERLQLHRGDYLSRHKIDGKIDPASCFRCHGRQNNMRCRTCHR